jgi:hypothetical protein
MLVPKLLQYFAKFCPKIMQNVETFIHFFIYLIVIHFVGLELLTSNLKEFFYILFLPFSKNKCPQTNLPNLYTCCRITRHYGSSAIPHDVRTSQTPCGTAVGPSTNSRGAWLPCRWARDPTAVWYDARVPNTIWHDVSTLPPCHTTVASSLTRLPRLRSVRHPRALLSFPLSLLSFVTSLLSSSYKLLESHRIC